MYAKPYKITQEVIGEWLHETMKARLDSSVVSAKLQYKNIPKVLYE